MGLLAAFVDSVREGKKQQVNTMAQDAVESHLLAFTAEQARLEKQVISTKNYKSAINIKF